MVRKKSESTADLVCDPEYIPVCVCVSPGDVSVPEVSGEDRSPEVPAPLREPPRSTGEPSLTCSLFHCCHMDRELNLISKSVKPAMLFCVCACVYVCVCVCVCVCVQSTRQERMLMRPFYDRYRLLKQLLLASSASPVITTIVRTTPAPTHAHTSAHRRMHRLADRRT